jgi:tRNA (guanine10-N2)-methyltransferase
MSNLDSRVFVSVGEGARHEVLHARVARRAVNATATSKPDANALRPPNQTFERTSCVDNAPLRVSLVSNVASVASASASASPPVGHTNTNLFAQLLLPVLGATALAVLAACVAGFLVAVRELVRACREATIASRAVSRCADSIDAACVALERTLAKADTVLDEVDKLGSTTASVLETASREAGVLQRRLSDLPNTASRTLMEAITRQYASPLLEPANGDATAGSNAGKGRDARGSGVWAGDVRITIGDVIEGKRDGTRWIGGKPGCNFTFNRSNRFRVGEYCAVPRNDSTYTWGVIELNDRDYSVDDSGEWSTDESEDEEDAPSCVWPPRDPDAIPDTCMDGSRDFLEKNDKVTGGIRAENSNWLERAVVKFVGDERSETLEGWVRFVTGMMPVEEGEYKVVVELDTDAYSFKIMNSGDLGKRVT